MTEYSFPTSVRLAIDWVNRNLIYGGGSSPYQAPKFVNADWVSSIRPGSIETKDEGCFTGLKREVQFLLKDDVMATVQLEGWRYSSSVTGRQRSSWAVVSVVYREIWIANYPDSSVISIECNNEPSTDGELDEKE